MTTYQPAEEIALVHSGEDYFTRLIRLLDEARSTIELQTYIFEADATGQMVASALKRAAERGVRVRVMADTVGSKKALPPAFLADLRAAGVEFRFFELFLSIWKWRGGRTLHHKVAVADARQALVGGINIADKYRGSPAEPPWLDFAVYIRGEVCAYLHDLCDNIYRHQYWKRRKRLPAGGALLPDGDRAGRLRFRQNDWLRRKTEVYQSFRQAIGGARSSLTIVASYFLPSASLRRQLAALAQRGVDVRILLTGPSDVELSRLAELYLTRRLVRSGIRVFQWPKSVMHGKVLLVDDRWASLGSYNINRLSRFRSVELNVDILDPGFVQHFSLYLDALLRHDCVEITADSLAPLRWWERLKLYGAYRLVYYLMRLLFPEKR